MVRNTEQHAALLSQHSPHAYKRCCQTQEPKSVAPSHSPTQPHSKAGRNQRDSGREGKVLLQWNGSNPHTQALTDQEEL